MLLHPPPVQIGHYTEIYEVETFDEITFGEGKIKMQTG